MTLALAGAFRQSSTSIDAEDLLGRAIRKALMGGTRSVTIDEAYADSLDALRIVAEGASQRDWDGYKAAPIPPGAAQKARVIIDLIPSTYPMPEISAHPDGELALNWNFGPRRVLTVSVNERGRLTYAALIGQDQQYGAVYLVDKFPEPIAAILRSLRIQGRPSVRQVT